RRRCRAAHARTTGRSAAAGAIRDRSSGALRSPSSGRRPSSTAAWPGAGRGSWTDDSAASLTRNVAFPRVRVASEVDLPPAPVAHVCVQLGRSEVGMAEHLLDAAEVGAALEEMRRERMSEQVRVDPVRFEAGALREAAEDQERSGSRQGASLRVQEELRAVAAVEERTAVRQIAAERLRGVASDR